MGTDMTTQMTGDPRTLQAQQTILEGSAAEAPKNAHVPSDVESDIDLDRVVYDPDYRDWARDQLNHVPSDHSPF